MFTAIIQAESITRKCPPYPPAPCKMAFEVYPVPLSLTVAAGRRRLKIRSGSRQLPAGPRLPAGPWAVPLFPSLSLSLAFCEEPPAQALKPLCASSPLEIPPPDTGCASAEEKHEIWGQLAYLVSPSRHLTIYCMLAG